MTDAIATLEIGPTFVRDPIRIQIVETGWEPWRKVFSTFHYLKDAGPMPYSTAFTGFDVASGDPVAFIGVSGAYYGKRRVARVCRMVIHQEWQGAGIGGRFLNVIAQREVDGVGFIGAPVPAYMHTAHPALVASLQRAPGWHQTGSHLVGDKIGGDRVDIKRGLRMGGHWRSVAGFRYDGIPK